MLLCRVFSCCGRFIVSVVSAFVKCFLAAWSNDALSDERDESHLLMPPGMFFRLW